MNARERTIAIVAGVVLGALALDAVFLTPLARRLSEATAGLEKAEQDLDADGLTLRRNLEAKRRWRDLGGNDLPRDASSAESLLLNRVRDWAQGAGLSLTGLRPEKDEKEEGFQKVTIRATGTGTTDQAAKFLYAAQTGDIAARVGDVQLTTRREGADDLTLSVGIATLYLPPEPAAGAATPEVRR